MTEMAERFESGVNEVIASHGVPWNSVRLGCRVEYHFQATPPRNGSEAVAADDRTLGRYMHLHALNRGILLTPFHNMALMCPATTESDIDRHTEAFAEARRRPRTLGPPPDRSPSGGGQSGVDMAPTIGQKLRQARTERGVELSEVERATKIRAKFLEAMEGDRWEDLPAPVYARGFLDIYARYLGPRPRRRSWTSTGSTVEGERRGAADPGLGDQARQAEQNRPARRLPSIGSINVGPVAKVLAGVLVVVVVGLVIVGSIGGSDNNGNGKTGRGEGPGSEGGGPAFDDDGHHEHYSGRRGLGRADARRPRSGSAWWTTAGLRSSTARR